MSRPSHLPSFSNPPLYEVVLGVQFNPPQQYSAVNARDVWELFRDEFSTVEEHHALEKKFEAFGGVNPKPNFEFKVGLPPSKIRLHFISEEKNSLIQFQEDRFLANWRKLANEQSYPRFDNIKASFFRELAKLGDYLERNLECKLDINQSEVSYINFIRVNDFSEIENWIKLWGGNQLKVDSLNLTYNEEVKDKVSQKPFARMYHELSTVVLPPSNEKAYRLAITFRGKPDGIDIPASMKFMELAREAIVTRFDEITTDKAHEYWGKIHE
ncbi:MAG: TIGR04255 family protein [Sneathiella sp.]